MSLINSDGTHYGPFVPLSLSQVCLPLLVTCFVDITMHSYLLCGQIFFLSGKSLKAQLSRQAKGRFKGSESLILEISMTFSASTEQMIRRKTLQAFSPASDPSIFILIMLFSLRYTITRHVQRMHTPKHQHFLFNVEQEWNSVQESLYISPKLFVLLRFQIKQFILSPTIVHFLQVCRSVKSLLSSSLDCLGV